MRLIDEKGRLFGKVNIIDFLALLFILSLVPMVYFGYRIFHPKAVQKIIIGPRFDIEVICKSIKLKPETAKLIAVGDKEYDAEGRVMAEVVSMGEIMPYTYELNIGSGRTIVRTDSALRQAIMRLKLNVVFQDSSIYYKNVLFSINTPFHFANNKYDITVVPISEYNAGAEIFEDKELDFYIILKELDEKTISLISKGDKEVVLGKGVIAEILGLGRIENNAFLFNLGSGTTITADEADRKQITVRMRLKCQLKDKSQLYFKEKKIEAGVPIDFEMGKYKAKGIIYQQYANPLSYLQSRRASIQVKFTGVMPEVANIMREGDIERDLSGENVAKIAAILENKPSDILTLRDNNWVTLKHPFYRDMLVRVDVFCGDKDGTYYFKNFPLKIGNSITFTTDLYSVSGTISTFVVE